MGRGLGWPYVAEMAWLRSIEAPMLGHVGRARTLAVISCLDAAYAAVLQSRRLLAQTTPDLAGWKRYLTG